MQQFQTCPRCGAQNYYGERFCGNCGLNLVQSNEPVPQPPHNQNPVPGGQQHFGQQPQGPGPQPDWGQQPPPGRGPQPNWGQPQQYNDPQSQGFGQQQGWNQPPQNGQQGQWGTINPPYEQNTYGTYSAYGDTYRKKKSSSTLIAIMVIVIILVFAVGGIGLATNGFSSDSSSASGSQAQVPATTPPATSPTTTPATTPATTPTTTPTTTVPQLTAEKLIADYSLDDVTAAGTYGGKTYIVTGTISSYSASALYVTLINKAGDTLSINCAFDSGSEESIAALTINSTVKIQCRISTSPLLGSNVINANKCVIIK